MDETEKLKIENARLSAELKETKILLAEKDITANTFMAQVKMLQLYLQEIADYDQQSIWNDSRDDAADAMLGIAQRALKPTPARWRCRRCGAVVENGRCRCETSPSPWEPI